MHREPQEVIDALAKTLADTTDARDRLAESVRAIAQALEDTAPRKGPNLGPCWCTHVRDIPPREDLHGVLCIRFRVAWRLGKTP